MALRYCILLHLADLKGDLNFTKREASKLHSDLNCKAFLVLVGL